VAQQKYGLGGLDDPNRSIKSDNPYGWGGPDDQDVLGWADDLDGSSWPDDINGSGRPNDQDKRGGLKDKDMLNQATRVGQAEQPRGVGRA